MISYALTAEEFNNLGLDDMREEFIKLYKTCEELEEERESLRDNIEDLKEELTGAYNDIRDREDSEESAGLELASACETFIKYQDGASDEWYNKDLRRFIDGIANAAMFLETSAIDRIKASAPIF